MCVCVHVFCICMIDVWMDERLDGWTDGRIDGWKVRWMDREKQVKSLCHVTKLSVFYVSFCNHKVS
jgi:hypothetical protein